jgi:hypothetical protein
MWSWNIRFCLGGCSPVKRLLGTRLGQVGVTPIRKISWINLSSLQKTSFQSHGLVVMISGSTVKRSGCFPTPATIHEEVLIGEINNFASDTV